MGRLHIIYTLHLFTGLGILITAFFWPKQPHDQVSTYQDKVKRDARLVFLVIASALLMVLYLILLCVPLGWESKQQKWGNFCGVVIRLAMALCCVVSAVSDYSPPFWAALGYASWLCVDM